MEQKKYSCYTDQGSWYFYADNDVDAMRVALWLCWRDGEQFDSIKPHDGPSRVLRITCIHSNGSIETL